MAKNKFFIYPEIDSYIDVFFIEESSRLTLLELILKTLNSEDHKRTPYITYRDNGELIFTCGVQGSILL